MPSRFVCNNKRVFAFSSLASTAVVLERRLQEKYTKRKLYHTFDLSAVPLASLCPAQSMKSVSREDKSATTIC